MQLQFASIILLPVYFSLYLVSRMINFDVPTHGGANKSSNLEEEKGFRCQNLVIVLASNKKHPQISAVLGQYCK